MRHVIEQVRREKEALAQGEFFHWLARAEPSDRDKLRFIPAMYAYVLSFRDLLSLLVGPEDGGLQSAVNAYVAEDASHYQWYLEDLASCGATAPDPPGLWDRRLLPARRAIYRMIGYAMEYQDIVLRVVLVMIFEATGEAFLRHTRLLVRRLDLDDALGYFGTRHYQDELNHSIQMDTLGGTPLDDRQRAVAERMVAEAFREYRGLFQSWKDFATDVDGAARLFDGLGDSAAYRLSR